MNLRSIRFGEGGRCAVQSFVAEDRGHGSLRLSDGDAGLETSEGDHPPNACVGGACLIAPPFALDAIRKGTWQEEILRVAWREIGEARFGDADNGDRNVVEMYGAADDGAIAAKGMLPVGVSQLNGGGGGRSIVRRGERATDEGVNAES